MQLTIAWNPLTQCHKALYSTGRSNHLETWNGRILVKKRLHESLKCPGSTALAGIRKDELRGAIAL
jgi:hypothetical protein